MLNLIAGIVLGVIAGAALALLYAAATRARQTRDIRRDAVSQSRAVTRGQVFEQFAPYFPSSTSTRRRPVPRQARGLCGLRRPRRR